ncbi:diguanylate cyclase (GGDEF) domain-containing protein [Desulfomicrobium apsheronum]|uniref:diguanylate cyclase n=1 Tax=Desulfomicrobium apsheronum TaxID=52560 RepID=A0A1I3PPY3_9BACT|nr:diguanylate cyclase [Desulfomicrobium apsheronum]SFJ23854.1 diguanylate cyclase (GGDEF) domain-containing protein [Desulfomicrobium apsheronum]
MSTPARNAPYGGTQTIRREMFLVGLFCLATIAIVVVSMLSAGIYRSGLTAAHDRISGANRQISAYVEAHLEGLAAAVRIMAASPDVILGDAGGEESRERALTYFRFVRLSNPNVKYCYAGYEDGEMLINTYVPPTDYDPRIRPWYAAAVKAWPEMNIGQPYRDAVDQEWLVAISSAFFDKTGLRGVVSVDSTLSRMDGLLNSIKSFDSQSNFVINTGGLLLVHNEKNVYINQNMDTIVPGALKLFKGDAGHIEYDLPGSGTRMAYFTKLKINDWIIISAVDRNEVMEPIRRRIVLTVSATALVTLLLGLLQLKIYESRFVTPLMTLKQRIADITEGKAAGLKPSGFSNAELASIADSIEGMTESSLGRKAAELRLILETTSDGLLVLDDQGGIMHYNRRFLELWNLGGALAGEDLNDVLIGHVESSVLPESTDDVLKKDHSPDSVLLHLKAGIILEQTARPLLEGSHVTGRLWSFKDVTMQIMAEEKLKLLAATDELTGLWNRRCFMDRAESEIAQAARLRRPLCLALMDADNFKHINDTYGHAAGDAALKYLADALRSRLRVSDTIGRIGGEEFAILLPDTSLETARTVLGQIRTVIEGGHFVHGDKELAFTVSIGVTAMPESRVSVDELLSVADAACYRAKTLGRNRIETQICEVPGLSDPSRKQ